MYLTPVNITIDKSQTVDSINVPGIRFLMRRVSDDCFKMKILKIDENESEKVEYEDDYNISIGDSF